MRRNLYRAKYAKEDNGGRVFNPPTPGFGKFAQAAKTFRHSNAKYAKKRAEMGELRYAGDHDEEPTIDFTTKATKSTKVKST